MALSDYSKLEYSRFLNIKQHGWNGNLLTANFGDGYSAGALSGNSSGLHQWSISSNFIPDKNDFKISSETYYEYFFNFFKAHIVLGNKPFLLHWKSKTWLVSFVTDQIDFEVITKSFFSGGEQLLKQRRSPELNFNADGSIDVSLAAPENLTISSITTKSNRVTFNTVTGSEYDIDYYELEVDGGTPFAVSSPYDHAGLLPVTEYCYRVRAVDVQSNISLWSSQICWTTGTSS